MCLGQQKFKIQISQLYQYDNAVNFNFVSIFANVTIFHMITGLQTENPTESMKNEV